MRSNVRPSERGWRSAGGVGLVATALFFDLQPGWALVAFLAGLAALASALFSYCPFNAVFGRGAGAGRGRARVRN